MNNIIAVVGMCGSGKSEATQLFEKHGYKKIYFGQATFDILAERGIERTPETERQIREELRASGDKGIYAKIYLPKIREEFKKGNVVIESLYSWSEYKYIKEEFGDAFKVLCIATDASLRYSRLLNRDYRSQSIEQSKTRDYTEIENIEKGGPISIADHYITNNADINTFKSEVEKWIESLK